MPDAQPKPTAAEIARFWVKVQPTGFCWEWTGARNDDGYGSAWTNGRSRRAHRMAYELLVGPIPDRMQLDHLCRNRACVNPDHVEIVTLEENVRRGYSPTAMNARLDRCRRGHPLDDAYLADDGRHCRECKAENNRTRPKVPCPTCGKPLHRQNLARHARTHSTAGLLATPEHDAQVLREAADAWQMDGWAEDVPAGSSRQALIIGMAQRAGDWLRARAARIEAGDPT